MLNVTTGVNTNTSDSTFQSILKKFHSEYVHPKKSQSEYAQNVTIRVYKINDFQSIYIERDSEYTHQEQDMENVTFRV